MTKEERIAAVRELLDPHFETKATDAIIDELNDRGFFTMPASHSHHGAYEGGLAEHSITVARGLQDLTDKLDLAWEEPRSPVVVGLFHDLCKLSDDRRGYDDASLIPGHGVRSVIYAQTMMQLTGEEIACIRWHMGAFEGEGIYNNYGCAVTMYPNVLFTHTADMIAARIVGV